MHFELRRTAGDKWAWTACQKAGPIAHSAATFGTEAGARRNIAQAKVAFRNARYAKVYKKP